MSEEIKNIDDIDDSIEAESKALTTVPSKIKKHAEAKKLIEEAKSMVSTNASELNDCKILLENDLRDYVDAKRVLHLGGLDESKALLVELGHITVSELEIEEEQIDFASKKDVEPIVIKDVNSGIFTGLIYAILTGIIALIGLVYLASEKLDITLDITKIPENDTVNSILNWFSSLVGMENNPEVGMSIMALTVAAVMLLVYAIRVSLKGGSNLRFANKQMKETQKFVTLQSNCKIEMDRVDMHIKNAIKIISDYQILLNEKHAKLVRILHFEGSKASKHGYSHTSKEEMVETQSMIVYIQDFITKPMSNEGKLSDESSVALEVAKENVEKVLSELYKEVV